MRALSILLGTHRGMNITSKYGNKNFYKGRGAPTMVYRGVKGSTHAMQEWQSSEHSSRCSQTRKA
jgi:hypothetical protein